MFFFYFLLIKKSKVSFLFDLVIETIKLFFKLPDKSLIFLFLLLTLVHKFILVLQTVRKIIISFLKLLKFLQVHLLQILQLNYLLVFLAPGELLFGLPVLFGKLVYSFESSV